MGQSTERWGVRDIKQRERKRMRLNKHNFHLFKRTRIFSMKIKSDFCIKAPNGLKENANSKLRKEVKEFIGNRTIGVWIFLCYRLAGKTMSHIHILFFFFLIYFSLDCCLQSVADMRLEHLSVQHLVVCK